MTRAEEAALKAYPKSTGVRELKGLSARPVYAAGYEQAEKDLIEKAVTWWRNNLVESEPTKGHYISAFKKYMENK